MSTTPSKKLSQRAGNGARGSVSQGGKRQRRRDSDAEQAEEAGKNSDKLGQVCGEIRDLRGAYSRYNTGLLASV